MERLLKFSNEHNLLRDQVHKFIKRECVPNHDKWERAGVVPVELWLRAGELGLLCPGVSEEFGGLGQDFKTSVVIQEEITGLGLDSLGFTLHSDIVAPYIESFGTAEQKHKWLPGMVSGHTIGALAMSEPGAGSDVAALSTRAKPEGDCFRISGSKVFISNGQTANLIIVAARTDDNQKRSHKGLTLFVVETEQVSGFRRGRNLEKLGAHAQDTSELFFDDMLVPAANILGTAGEGFAQMMQQLAQERLVMAVRSVAASIAALEMTVEYVKQRKAFGKTLFDFQNTRFELAEMKTAIMSQRIFVDHCISLHTKNKLDAVDAAMAKYSSSEMQFNVMDRCLQLFGGWGYMVEFPIARLWADSRVFRIAGGTSEIMKEVISKSI